MNWPGDPYAFCSKQCERIVYCVVCFARKCPAGRDPGLHGSFCDHDCSGYRLDPQPGHLWPGELERIREQEDFER